LTQSAESEKKNQKLATPLSHHVSSKGRRNQKLRGKRTQTGSSIQTRKISEGENYRAKETRTTIAAESQSHQQKRD